MFYPCRALVTLSVTTKGQGNGSEVKVSNRRLITHGNDLYLAHKIIIQAGNLNFSFR